MQLTDSGRLKQSDFVSAPVAFDDVGAHAMPASRGLEP
jgi:hypothetical protein